MRSSGVCPKCGGDVVMKLAVVGDATDFIGSGGGAPTARRGQQLVPRQILATTTSGTGLFGGTTKSWEEGGGTGGYVCTACGYRA